MNPWQFVGKEIVVLKEHSCARQILAWLCAAELALKKKARQKQLHLYFTSEGGNTIVRDFSLKEKREATSSQIRVASLKVL